MRGAPGLGLILLVGCARQFPAPASSGPLTVQLLPNQVGPDGGAEVDVQGGQPPYEAAFSTSALSSSGSSRSLSLDAGYHAGELGDSVDVIQVSDAQGAKATASVLVGPALTIIPPSVSAAPGSQLHFTLSGGQTPYTLTPMCPGFAPLDAGFGGFQIDSSCEDEQVLVVATDANGVQVTAVVQVGAGLTISPAQVQAVPGQTLIFAASGGEPPYQFRYGRHGDPSGGTLSSSGYYQAGVNPDTTDVVEVVDGQHTLAIAQVNIGNPELQLPAASVFNVGSGDFNGDGVQDVVALALSPIQSYVEVILGGVTGWFGSSLVALPTAPCVSTLGDFNGDGYQDLALGFGGPQGCGAPGAFLQVYLGQPSGSLVPGPEMNPLPWLLNGPMASAALPGEPASLLISVLDPANDTPAVAVVSLSPIPSDGGAFPLRAMLEPLSNTDLSNLGVQNPFIFPVTRLNGAGSLAVLLYYDDQASAGGCTVGAAPPEGYPYFAPSSEILDDGGFALVGGSLWPTIQHDCSQVSPGLVDLLGTGNPGLYLYDELGDGSTLLWQLPGANGPGPLQTYHAASAIVGALDHPVVLGSPQEEIDLTLNSAGARLVCEGNSLSSSVYAPLPATLDAEAAGDFNGDGFEDLAVVDPTGKVDLLEGSFGGQVGRPSGTFYGGSPGSSLMATDLDGDGLADLFIGTTDGLKMLGSVGDGSFAFDFTNAFPLDRLAFMTSASNVGWGLGVDQLEQTVLVSFSFGPAAGFDAGMGTLFPITEAGLNMGNTLGLFASPDGAWLTVVGQGHANLYNVSSGAPAAAGQLVLGSESTSAAVYLGDAGPDLAFFYSSGSSGGELALFPFSGQGGIAWTNAPTSTGPAPPQILNLISYPIRVGGRVDQVAGVYYQGQPGGCQNQTGGWTVEAFDLSSGQVPASNYSRTMIEDNCQPLAFGAPLNAFDVDGDGITDLVATDSISGLVWIFHGVGDGTFQCAQLTFQVPVNAVVGGRFKRDGGPSLALERADIPAILIWDSVDGGYSL